MYAREVWQQNRPEFIRRFCELKATGICTDLYLHGSVFYGDDDEQSDIDLMVAVTSTATISDMMHIENYLTEWIDFPVHINSVPKEFCQYFVNNNDAEEILC